MTPKSELDICFCSNPFVIHFRLVRIFSQGHITILTVIKRVGVRYYASILEA